MVWLAILCALLALSSLYLSWRLTSRAAGRVAELGSVRDAGTKLAAQAANSRLRLNAFSESSGAGILMFDKRGLVVHANITAEAILRVERGSLLGRSSGCQELDEFAAETFHVGGARTTDLSLRDPENRVLRVSGYPFEVGLSGVPEVMLVLADVTERRRLENLRRDFVANVSHELRTPLASIRVIAETLQDGAIDDPMVAERFLETIVKETDRLERITNDLLVLSNAEGGVPTLEQFDLGELVRDVLSRYEARARSAGVELILDLAEPLPVCVSRDQMDHVVLNLIDNSIKYTRSGGRLTVRSRRAEGFARVDFEDTGIGIEKSDLALIFERFYRVDRSRSGRSRGTGLGLSIVKDVVEAAGGRVSVSSEVGLGTTFTIHLPLDDSG